MTTKERFGFAILTLAGALVGGAISGHFFGATTVGAAATPKLITSQKFVLVDSNGNPRGEFGVTDKGVAQLAVFDGTSALRAGLGVAADGGPALGIFGKDGKARAEIGLASGNARVILFDPSGKPQVALGVAYDGQDGL